MAVLALAVAFASEQVVEQRRWAKGVLREPDLTKTIEYRSAVWMDAHMPHNARVMLPGSMAQWLNAFSDRPQWTGSSWATAANPEQQYAVGAVLVEQGTVDTSLVWLRAYGVQAVAVSGPKSPEFWKPVLDKTKYEAKFDVLWREDDTTLYKVPLKNTSLAHALSKHARTVKTMDSIKGYVAALDAERTPGLTLTWQDRNHARIQGDVRHGEAVSLQVTHHAGWHALANGQPAPVHRDALGLMWIEPSCNGPCSVELTYNGGAELIACRWISYVTLVALTALLMWGAWSNAALLPSRAGTHADAQPARK